MERSRKSGSKQGQVKPIEAKKPIFGKKIGTMQDKSSPRDLRIDKPVWAAYANMARQNICQTLCHISHVIGYEVDKNNSELEENLLGIPAIKILTQRGKAEVKAKSIKMLEKHFPFLNPMVEKLIQLNGETDKAKTPDLYHEVFVCILPLVNLLRNFYSHHVLIDARINARGKIVDDMLVTRCHKLVSMLDYCMTGARRIVKERFTVGEKSTFKEEDFKFFEGENRYFDYVMVNEDGLAILDDKGRLQKIKREKKSYVYKVVVKAENERYTRLTNMGVYLLFCLFLNKKYAKEFGDKIDFWGRNSKKNCLSENVVSIIHEISCVYRMHLPKDRLQSEKDRSAVGLDMLNELKKCPRELFETLSVKDQEKFRVEVKDKENTDGNKVLLLRSFDRFPVLALQYLDAMKRFNSIRFQVELGNYRYKFYSKENWIDRGQDESKDRVRVLQKELMGYGRLDEIERQRKERWAGLVRAIDQPRADTFGSAPYITDHHASYHIENNHIGLQWNTRGVGILDKSGIFMPSTDLPKKADENRMTIAECHAPKCWLSVYDLPAVCFLTCLTGSGERAEKLIVNTTEKYMDFFRAIGSGEIEPYNKETKESLIPIAKKDRLRKDRKEGKAYSYIIEPYGIDIAALPRKVQDYLLGDSARSNGNVRFRHLALAKLEGMREYTERKLEVIESNRKLYASKENKLGKQSHVDIRQGTLARFLAKDMVYFKKPDKNGKNVLTSQNFDVLQKELALFEKTLPELTRIFVNAELICCRDKENNHPFLQSVLDSKPLNFLDFYTCYLVKRRKYLEECIKKNDYDKLHFLHPDRSKWHNRNKDFYRELVSRYTTIELPGNLFLGPIVEELQKLDFETLKYPEVLRNALAQERKNVAFLISAYMQATGDGCQAFYGYERGYKYFAMTYSPKWDFSNPIAKLADRYLTVNDMEKFFAEKTADDRRSVYLGSLEERKMIKTDNLKRKGRYDFGKERALNKELRADQETADEKLGRCLKFYKQNERDIRRQKVQDAVLFLMAKDVLTHTMKDADLSAYQLRYIGEDNDSDILSMQLPFAVKLQVNTDDGRVEEITIRQGDLKLKNYGDFFRFIYDSRIQPLLAQVGEKEIDRGQLEKELDNYDMARVPLFRYVHDLESRVCDTLTKEQFYQRNAEGKPMKVDFKYLLQFVNLKDSNKELLRVIRNAFCHSTYPEGAKVSVVFDKEARKCSMPNVAKILVEDFTRRSKSATPKQNAMKKQLNTDGNTL